MDWLDLVPEREEITASAEEGKTVRVRMHDGSLMRLHKLDKTYDPRDSEKALVTLRKRYAKGQVVTGLLYIYDEDVDLHSLLGTTPQPLNAVPMSDLCPGNAELAKINKSLR
jgi:2-oxoglutarate ferredoxin oxidoreductase subunit beta